MTTTQKEGMMTIKWLRSSIFKIQLNNGRKHLKWSANKAEYLPLNISL